MIDTDFDEDCQVMVIDDELVVSIRFMLDDDAVPVAEPELASFIVGYAETEEVWFEVYPDEQIIRPFTWH